MSRRSDGPTPSTTTGSAAGGGEDLVALVPRLDDRRAPAGAGDADALVDVPIGLTPDRWALRG